MAIKKEQNLDEKKVNLIFSNGAYEQLQDLQNAYDLDDITKVVELAVNILDLAKNKKIYLENEQGEKSIVKIHNE